MLIVIVIVIVHRCCSLLLLLLLLVVVTPNVLLLLCIVVVIVAVVVIVTVGCCSLLFHSNDYYSEKGAGDSPHNGSMQREMLRNPSKKTMFCRSHRLLHCKTQHFTVFRGFLQPIAVHGSIQTQCLQNTDVLRPCPSSFLRERRTILQQTLFMVPYFHFAGSLLLFVLSNTDAR